MEATKGLVAVTQDLTRMLDESVGLGDYPDNEKFEIRLVYSKAKGTELVFELVNDLVAKTVLGIPVSDLLQERINMSEEQMKTEANKNFAPKYIEHTDEKGVIRTSLNPKWIGSKDEPETLVKLSVPEIEFEEIETPIKGLVISRVKERKPF